MEEINKLSTASQIEDNEPANYEQKCLCVLVLDTSGSMNADNNIKKLNDGLSSFKKDVMNDPVAKDRLELAIVTFNSKVDVVQQPDLLENVTMPVLQASGQTQLVAAIQEAQKIVADRKVYYTSKGLSYYRPWIVVMTDGDPYPPGQDVDGLSAQIHTDVQNKRYVLMAIGVGDDVQDAVLSKLATPNFPALRMSEVKFSEFFQWLSNSIGAVVSQPAGTPATTAPVTDWAKGFVIDTTV